MENIHEHLKKHEITAEWEYQNKSELFYQFFDKFNSTFFENKLPLPVFAFKARRKSNLGYYKIGTNEFGIKDEIGFNIRHINRPKFKLLSTLLHEMTHLFEIHFREDDGMKYTNRHSKFFREKTKEMGIPSDKSGCTIEIEKKFLDFLKENGINIEEKEITEEANNTKKNYLKWRCKCSKIMSGRKNDLNITCNICGEQFESEEI